MLLFLLWSAYWCMGKRGQGPVEERWPSDHQSQQSSSSMTSMKVSDIFWLPWLMCFWRAGKDSVKPPFWQWENRSHIILQPSSGIRDTLLNCLLAARWLPVQGRMMIYQKGECFFWNSTRVCCNSGDRKKGLFDVAFQVFCTYCSRCTFEQLSSKLTLMVGLCANSLNSID